MKHLRALLGWDRSDRRRMLQIALGVVWLIDAALQFQPYMFKRTFVSGVLAPSAEGVPGFLGHAIMSMGHFLLPHIAEWNALFAVIQLVIALGILCKPTVKVALAASVLWSVMVWWFGEGFGGLFTSTSPVMGLPGAVILYAALAVLLWPPKAGARQRQDGRRLSVAEESPIHPLPARIVWAVLWVAFALYCLLPVNSAPNAFRQMVAGMGTGEPGWMRATDSAIANALAGDGRVLAFALAAACLVFAGAVFTRWDIRPVLVGAIALSLLIWIVEDFGGIFTGTGTDVNSGPLLVLLVLAYWRPAWARAARREPLTRPRSATVA